MNVAADITRYIEECETTARNLGNLQHQVDECNLSLCDLDHYLELEDLSDEELVALQKLRKCVMIARRKAKDQIRILDQILPKQIEGRTTRDRYEYAVRNLEGRVYTPKVVTLADAVGRTMEDTE